MLKSAIRTGRLLAASVLLLLSAAVANAQQVCVVHETVVANLAGQYDEQVTARGLFKGGKAVVELFVSKAGTWTVIVTGVNGRSCIVASGESWMQVPLLVGDPA